LTIAQSRFHEATQDLYLALVKLHLAPPPKPNPAGGGLSIGEWKRIRQRYPPRKNGGNLWSKCFPERPD